MSGFRSDQRQDRAMGKVEGAKDVMHSNIQLINFGGGFYFSIQIIKRD